MTSTPQPPPPILPPPPPTLPPPPPILEPQADATQRSRTGRRYVADRPGQLTLGWTTVFWFGWLLVAGSFGAVWYSSYLTGFATWWLGPESDPRIPLMVIPFIAPITLCVLALRGARRLPWLGIGGAVLTAGIAAGDLGARTGYSLVEFGIAAAALLVSLACFAGMLRDDRPTA